MVLLFFFSADFSCSKNRVPDHRLNFEDFTWFVNYIILKLIPVTDNCFLFSASKSAGGLSSLKGAPSLGNSGLGSLKGAPPLPGMNNNNRGE